MLMNIVGIIIGMALGSLAYDWGKAALQKYKKDNGLL